MDRKDEIKLTVFFAFCSVILIIIFIVLSLRLYNTMQAEKVNDTAALHTFTSRVVGDSMTPTIFDGDLVEWGPVNTSFVGVGDVVVYDLGVLRVAHRVIFKYNCENYTFFVVKGDNNSYVDSVGVRSDKVLGVVEPYNNSRNYLKLVIWNKTGG